MTVTPTVAELRLNISASQCFTDPAAAAEVAVIHHNTDLNFISVLTAEGLRREDARGSVEETGPSTGRAFGYPAHSSTIPAPVIPPSCSSGGLSQPQQEEKEFRSGIGNE